jgi:hypothetical protein
MNAVQKIAEADDIHISIALWCQLAGEIRLQGFRTALRHRLKDGSGFVSGLLKTAVPTHIGILLS